jgi:hypothetical protein
MNLTDEEIAKIGSETRLSELPEMLDDDQWNNIEPALLEFARKIIKAMNRESLAEAILLTASGRIII